MSQFISPLAWPGGKAKYINKILKYMPKEIDDYIEPFFGGGSIGLKLLFEKRIKGNVFLNDLNSDLINFWKDVKKQKIIKEFPILNSEEQAKKIYLSIPKMDKKGWEFLLINRLSFSGMERAGFSKTRFNLKYYNCLNRVEICEKLLNEKQAAFFNLDYSEVIEKYDNKNCFIYLDPPYHNVSKNLYVHEKMDFEKLKDVLQKVKGKFILSLNDNKYIRNLFKEFNIYEESWKYSMTNGSKKEKRNMGKELIIRNY